MNLRQILNNSKIPLRDKLNHIKVNVRPSEYGKIFRNNLILNKYIIKDLFLPELTNVKNNEPYTFTRKFEHEFHWVANKILLNSNKLKDFLILYNEYNSTFLLGDYIAAGKLLDQIKLLYGHSLWTIEAELHLAENNLGSTENWKLLSSYLVSVNNPIYEFCISACSKRIESSVTFESYLNQFQNDLGSMKTTKFLSDFFVFNSFKLASFTFNYPDLSSVLYVSNILSLVDQYHLLIDVMIHNVSNNHDEYFESFKSFSKRMLDLGFEDVRLINILNTIDNNSEVIITPVTTPVYSALEAYYHGNYNEAKLTTAQLITEFPDNFELYEVYIKSLINLDLNFSGIGNSNIDEILLNLYNFLTFQKISEKAGSNLLKLANKYVNLNIGSQLMGFLYEVENNLKNKITYYFTANHNTFKILTSTHFRKNLLIKYEIFEQYNFSIYRRGYLGEKDVDISEYNSGDYRQKYTLAIVSSYNAGHFEDVIEIVKRKDLIAEDCNYYRERFVFYYYKALIKQKRLDDALELFDIIHFDDSILFYKIKHDKLYHLVFDDTDKFHYLHSFSALVMAFLYNSGYDLYEYLDEYLSIHNIIFSSLDNLVDSLRHDHVVYMLSKIYTIDTLKYYFQNITDVEEFRIKVLETLCKIDQTNTIIYEDEIYEIERNFSVRNVLKEVNNARLFVDIAKLKEILISKYTDDFTRLLRIVAEKKESNLLSFNPSKKRDWEKSFKESNETFINNYDDADFIAFKNIYYYIRDQFLFSKEYGLDSCLSTRIRHGALKNQIRSVFDSLNLMTTKLGNEYRDNIHWGSQIEDEVLYSDIQNILKKFSAQIDELNDFVVTEIIQIRHELNHEKAKGIFNYSSNDEVLHKFFTNHFTYLKTTEDTVDLLLNDLAFYTNISICENIEHQFQTVLFADFKKIIFTTIDRLSQLQIPNNLILLDNLNKSITDLQTCFDEILEWFVLETSSSSNLLKIEDIISASFIMTKRLYNNFKIKENINVLFKDVAGYSSLIYVFNIIFSNAILHSNLVDEIEITVNVSLEEDNFIKISVINNVSNIDQESTKSKLAAIKSNWTNLGDIDRSNIEGQSGFDKIKRIMIYEAKCITDRFNYVVNKNEVEICLYLAYKKLEPTHENPSN